ncbi:hypothetical protein GCM10027060_19920 [Nesterenkonia halophila]|uniref:variant leucine-rich repeat-containing protein n=1 Tax=Nesterenkonia halophila TaxID=302044 RepID=UPI001292953F|nr:hypothetical protein [Nesterenkonia halophila]
MTFSYDDVRRLASDPESEWDTLHWIAEEYPELRPAVAANPATYPELLEALADLEDPAITAALMRRFNPEAAPAEGAEHEDGEHGDDEPDAKPGDDEHPDEHAGAGSAESSDAGDSAPEAAGAATAAHTAAATGPAETSAPTQATDEPPTSPEPTETAGATGTAGTAAGAASPGPEADGGDGAEEPAPALPASTLAAGAGTGISAAALQERARRRRSRVGLVLLAVVLPIIAVVAIAALVIMLLDDRGDPQAEPGGDAASETSSSPSEASPEPSPSPTGPTLDELRTAVSELPQTSSCEDVTDDVDVFTAYAERAADEDSWSTEDDELVQRTVEDLQAECGALQSAQVHQQLTGESSAGIAAAAEDMGTGWIEINAPAEGAMELASFMTPSGNVRCEMGDRLHCSIVEHDFSAPEGCDEADLITYQSTLRTTAAPDCEDPVEEADREILPYGQTTTNEYFACQSMRSKLSCWNKITGEGFNLSRSTHSTY